MKRFWVSCLSLVMVAGLAGCGKSPEQAKAPSRQAKNPRLAEFSQAPPLGKNTRLLQSFPLDALPPMAVQQEAISGKMGQKAHKNRQEIEVVIPAKTTLDSAFSSDKKGSVKVVAYTPGRHVIALYELKHPGTGNARLACRAMVSTSDIRGQAYLQMVIKAEGREPAVIENRLQSLHAASYPAWVELETPYMVSKDEKIESLRLNFVLQGIGTAWVDNLRLYGTPE